MLTKRAATVFPLPVVSRFNWASADAATATNVQKRHHAGDDGDDAVREGAVPKRRPQASRPRGISQQEEIAHLREANRQFHERNQTLNAEITRLQARLDRTTQAASLVPYLQTLHHRERDARDHEIVRLLTQIAMMQGLPYVQIPPYIDLARLQERQGVQTGQPAHSVQPMLPAQQTVVQALPPTPGVFHPAAGFAYPHPPVDPSMIPVHQANVFYPQAPVQFHSFPHAVPPSSHAQPSQPQYPGHAGSVPPQLPYHP